ncbi:SusC/RagA family TonB-linked outer membrane protein [Aestuariibaculum lutulentum]|uniref:SusC/RagA family TonB-linked outer membrane protein n=1 Tax=Aestuariibaculum lutulentum TaxID=2920935 RepID=A0ABS9RF11_9FLAO|nr:SusC/RagA family TonB-linked outer membrane protein [Aestuariibaculum lutulentum]MCH4551526.1 SusC/RagA family TonB-linked outer membrane protein [Aestuariibaculum lutulentum]
MKTKFSRILTLLIAFVVQLTFAQEKTISGKITDPTGMPLPGATILIKGTTTGTSTDFDGNYSITASQGQTLVFSYVGYSNQEIVVGTSNIIDIKLSESAESLEEVVVTALGISRDKKSLGYSTQEVRGDELTSVQSSNFTNNLSGKASGIKIARTTNMGGSTNVLIRGNTSLTGDNQALFVIDGVPINNINTNTRGQEQASGGNYDYGNTASDINPDDIESINILKGAAASALYGSRAANGVIMITTKKGKKSKGFGVTVSSGVTFGSIDKSTFPKYQNQYGAGYGPYYDGPGDQWYYEDIDGDGNPDLVAGLGEDASYGPAFDPNLLVYQWDAFDVDSPNYGKATPWVSAGNRGAISFFETPVTLTNSVSLDRGSDDGTFRLNYTKFDQTGLLPNSSIDKHNFSMSGSYKFNEKLHASAFANYLKTNGLGRNSTGYNDNILGNMRQWWQTNVDVQDQKDIYFATRRNVTWNPTYVDDLTPIYWDNPYWTRYENYQSDERNRFIGNMSLTYDLTEWLTVTGRIATDTYNELQEERRQVGSVPADFGIGTGRDGSINRNTVDSGYLRRDIFASETNYDLFFNVDKDITDDFNIKGILGVNINRTEFSRFTSATQGGISVPGLYTLKNTRDPLALPVETVWKNGVDGTYASLSFGFMDTYFLDATIRRDHVSTLPEDNSVFYYPGVSGSFIFSKLIDQDWLSFGKFSANYAEVGNGARGRNRLQDFYDVNTPFGSASTSVNDTKSNPDLKPERTKSYEFGLQMNFFKSRVGFDFAYYNSKSIDQIVDVRVSESTGYLYKTVNAGEIENKGVEFSLNGKPIQTEDFVWNININWTRNRNKVLALPEGLKTLQLGDFQGGVTINAQVGEPYGVIYGTDYTYLDPDNPSPETRLVDPDSGEYLKTSTSDNVIGDSNPEWLMGISNRFTYKNFTLGFLIDIQKGGNIWSLDQYYGLATGLYTETAFTNDLGNPVRDPITGTPGNYGSDSGGFINKGVNPDGSVNETRINANRYGAFGYRRGLPDKAFSYDAGFVKLREVTLTYTFPESLLKNTFFTGASLGFVGSNLWIIDKSLPHADPESGLGAGNLQGYSTGSLPSTRDFGFNVKLQF